ncbi:MAG TPA: amidohydrolase family protein [Acidimicrobiia bacterium]|nr:amidohydrolase family protein [Acidimicrobiia bacterium]
MSDTIAFADTHIHFWEQPHPTLRWDWLEPGTTHPVFGDMSPLIELRTYSAREFVADIAGCDVTKAVHVQAALGTPDPVEESRWLEAMAEDTGWPTAIVAHVSLQDADAATTIERHLQYSRVRGVRDLGRGDYLVDPAFEHGYAILEQYGLVYDLDVKWEGMADAASLARRHPGTTMVVEHAGFPTTRTAEYFHAWRSAMNAFGPLENVFIKISGLGMGDRAFGRDWTIETLRPWVEESIEIFGVERSFFGTNFPVDRMFSTYHDLLTAYRALVAEFSEDDRHALFHRNAERVYRI